MVVRLSPDTDTSPVVAVVDQNRHVSVLGRYGINTLGNLPPQGRPPGDSGT